MELTIKFDSGAERTYTVFDPDCRVKHGHELLVKCTDPFTGNEFISCEISKEKKWN